MAKVVGSWGPGRAVVVVIVVDASRRVVVVLVESFMVGDLDGWMDG